MQLNRSPAPAGTSATRRGGPGLAGTGRRMAPPWSIDRAFGTGSNADPLAEIVGRLDIPRRDERRHPRRRVASAGPRDRCRRGQRRHGRAGEPGLDRPGDRRARRPDRGRPRRAGHHLGGARGWTSEAATSGKPSIVSTARAAPVTSSPMSPRTACSKGPTSTCFATSVRTRRARGRLRRRLDAGRHRRDPCPGADRGRGAIIGSALYKAPSRCPKRSTSRGEHRPEQPGIIQGILPGCPRPTRPTRPACRGAGGTQPERVRDRHRRDRPCAPSPPSPPMTTP